MAACRRISFFTSKTHLYLLKPRRLYSTGVEVQSSKGVQEIDIPYRIERGPTDILKALASTISKDFTAPHYKFEDDPYFIPSSNLTKRSFALSKESGKKAARYFLENYPDLFKCNVSVPHIKSFDPPVVYTEENVNSVEPLRTCIEELDVEKAMHVYDLLKKKNVEISQKLKQELLELLCFYNCSPPVPEEYYEERFYSLPDANRKQWDSRGLAEKLFEEMEQNNKAYSAMICGLAKFQYAEKALDFYSAMKEKGFLGTVEMYNNLLSVVHFIKDDNEHRWNLATQLLGQMSADGLRPDLHTMNGVLELLTRTARWKKTPRLVMSILSEMKRLNIEPSLGSYHFVLMAFCSNNFSNCNVLYEIISLLEDKEFEIRHPSDILFFSTAMEVCWKGTRDKALVARVHKLLEYKKNCKFLGHAHLENQYFKCFFRALCELEDSEKLMQLYEKYVPNTYTPEPSVMLAVVQAIHFTGNYAHLPKLCSDVLFFGQTEREDLLKVLLEAAACMKHDDKVQKDLINMVWNILENLNKRAEAQKLKLDFTGALMDNFLKTFLFGDDLKKAWDVIQQLKNEEYSIIGYPEKSTLLKFCELGLVEAEYEKVLFCMKYAVRGAYPEFYEDIKVLADNMVQQGKLDENQKTYMTSLFQSTSVQEDASNLSDSSSSDDDDDSSSEEEEPPKIS